jgi:hypothetical protein
MLDSSLAESDIVCIHLDGFHDLAQAAAHFLNALAI